MSSDRSASLRCAIAIGTLCGLVVAATWLPLGWVIPEGITFTLFLLIFPLFGWTVIREAKGAGEARPSDLLRRVPQPAKFLIGASWILLWLSALSSFSGPAGQPVTENGRLYLNNHGELTEVDQDTYDEAQNRGARGFMSVATGFCVAAGVMSKYGGPRQE